MPVHTTTLPNGLQLIGETLPTSRSVTVGFYVKTGARDEGPDENGVSHFLEHMMFKGTPRRTALDVNLDFDRIGASYNAFTSEEVTAYYASVLPEYLPQATDILTDILRPSLRQADFDTEKQVILEEIGMYEDMPASAAFERARKAYYRSHPLGQSILGSVDSITTLTRDQMQGYFDRRYVPSNIVAVAAGNFDWNRFVDLAGQGSERWIDRPAPATIAGLAPNAGGMHPFPKEGVAQVQTIVLSPGADAAHSLRYAQTVLAVAVGDESGSRLYWALVDPGKADGATCSVDQNHGSGVVVSFMTCEPAALTDNLATLQAVLADVQAKGLTADELATAKAKIASRVVRGNERPMGRMRGLAGAWIYRNEISDPDSDLAKFDAVTADTIRECLDRYPLDQNTVVTYGPVAG